MTQVVSIYFPFKDEKGYTKKATHPFGVARFGGHLFYIHSIHPMFEYLKNSLPCPAFTRLYISFELYTLRLEMKLTMVMLNADEHEAQNLAF